MSDDTDIKRQQRGEESKLAMLEAGVELLRQHDFNSVLSASKVSERSHRSSGSFFHYWKSTDDYINELFTFVLRPGTVSEVEDVAALLDQLGRDPRNPVAVLRLILRQNFTNTVSSPHWPIQLLLSTHHDPRAQRAVRRFYEHTADLLVPQIEHFCKTWNRKARAPHDLRTFEIITTAVVEGLAIRKLVQPELIPDSLSAEVILALVTVFLTSYDDPAGLDEVIGEIDHYPGGRDHSAATNPPGCHAG